MLFRSVLEDAQLLAVVKPAGLPTANAPVGVPSVYTILRNSLTTGDFLGVVSRLDAPVSGGQAGAENGVLTVMCGSDDEAAFARAAEVIASYSRSCVRLGTAGAGQLAKMVNQVCIAGLVQALSEGIAFASNAGLDPHAVLDVISKGAAQSWQMENRGHTMADGKFDFGFAVEWMVKDLGFVIDEARRNGSSVPVTETVLGYYRELMGSGSSRLDTSSLITRLPR